MTGTDFEALVRVLEDEVEHLGALEALLTDESRALRRLDRAALEALAPQMEAQVARHFESALARNLALRSLLPDLPDPTLSALVARGLDPDGRVAALQAVLRDRVRTVQHQRTANEAYARTGRRAIEGRLARILQRKSATTTTYGRAGRFIAPNVGPTLRDRG
jgi:hypothetical protein